MKVAVLLGKPVVQQPLPSPNNNTATRNDGGGVVGYRRAAADPSTPEKPYKTVFCPFIAVFVRFPEPAGTGIAREIRHSTVFGAADRH
jgi:hypothetical protein